MGKRESKREREREREREIQSLIHLVGVFSVIYFNTVQDEIPYSDFVLLLP